MNLLLTNAIVFGILAAIWSKNNWLNLLLKAFFMVLLVLNAIQYAKI